MDLMWTGKALSDLERLFEFFAPVNHAAAIKTVRTLVGAPKRLLENPRIGEKLEEFNPREVRRLLIGHYEMRYELRADGIYMLRVWHTREDR